MATPIPVRPGEVNLGTTIMAVEFDGGVVIGADSRTTTGAYIANRVTDKLTKVHDRVYCCRSGSAADTQAIADMVHYYLQMYSVEHNEPPEVETAARLFQEIVYQNKGRLMAGIIVAGWDKYHKGRVYSVNLGGTLVREPFSIGGSGSGYIYGFCDKTFRPGMTRDECVTFVSNAISLAIARDGSSGGVIRMAVIDEKGVERLFIPGNKMPTQWELS